MSAPKSFGTLGADAANATTAAAFAPHFKGLTAKMIRESMKSIDSILGERPARTRVGGNLFGDTPRSVFGGVPIITSPFLPPEQPAIQVRDICLKDGTPLLSAQFLARENAWWRERYGMRPVAFMLGDTMAVHPQVQALIAKACKSLDSDMMNIMMGRQP